MSLWFINAVLILSTLALLLKPLLAKQTKPSEERGGQRQDLLANRLAEIEREHSVGLIDVDQYDRAREETRISYSSHDDDVAHTKTLLTPIKAAMIVVLFVSSAVVFYFKYSDGHRMLSVEKQAQEMIEIFDSMTAALRSHLEKNPQDAEARLRLAEAYYLVGDFAGAITEYRLVDKLGALTENSQWLNYADALLRSAEIGQTDTVVEALERLLNTEPDNQRALFISASLHFEREEYARAINLWQRLLALLSPGESGTDQALQELILQAENRLAQDQGRQGTTTADNVITVVVSLAAALASMASPSDTVFVYARAIGGMSMPVAIKRLTVAELPATVILGDSDAMSETANLSQFEQVEIVARVSKRGQALTAAGDLIGVASPVIVGGSIRIEIAELVK